VEPVHRARSGGRFRGVIGLFLLVIALMVGYNAVATNRQRGDVLIVNVAGRQRALAERFVQDVLLRVDGYAADPEADADMLTQNADALLKGGEVLAVQGADATIRIGPARDPKSAAKLRQARSLIAKLIETGSVVEASGNPSSPDFSEQLLNLRIIGAQVSSVSNDAVGQLTRHTESSLARLVWVGIVLWIVGAVAAIGMALVVRRAGARQAAQFRSLVQNASDLVTVVDARGTIRYQSASSEQMLGIPSADLLGTNLFDAVHEEDAPSLRATLDDLLAHPSAVARVEYRVRTGDGSWRHVESALTNSVRDPSVNGLVLNTRDMTERHEADRKLRRLQAERGSLLEQTVQATELERKRVAAELHDGPVQHLTALDMRLEGLRRRLEPSEDAGPVELVNAVQERLRTEVRDLRRMMSGLRPPMLDERGLPAALGEHLNDVGRETGMECSLRANLAGRLDAAHEVILYRVAQEAINNVIKHSQAKHALVVLHEAQGHVFLEVCDDGVGFDTVAASTSPLNGHFGLVGMRERVELAGGRWTVTTRPGHGTVVRADLPIEVMAR
jgi:PAS domain S-box-containing protein